MSTMYVSWGNFNFAGHEAGIGLSVDVAYSDRGFPMHSDVRFLIDGELCAGSSIDTNTRLEQIRDAFNFNYQDIAYRFDNGTPSVHSLANNDPSNMTGNQVVSASYPQTIDGEFVSGRKFQIGIAAKLKLDGFSNVLSYEDNLRFIGNAGPDFELRKDRWVGYYFEMVSPNSIQTISHTGRKVTSNTWHLPPTPLLAVPFEDNLQRQVTLGAPKIYPNGATNFVTSWSYLYRTPVSLDTLRPRTGYN